MKRTAKNLYNRAETGFSRWRDAPPLWADVPPREFLAVLADFSVNAGAADDFFVDFSRFHR